MDQETRWKTYFEKITDGLIKEEDLSQTMIAHLKGMHRLQEVQNGGVVLSQAEIEQLRFDTDLAGLTAQVDVLNQNYLTRERLSRS